MGKRKRLEKKKRKRVRTRDWEKHGEYSFTHDRVKHRRAQVKLPETAEDQQPLPMDFTPNATVIAHSKKWAFVRFAGKERLCLIDERLKPRERASLLAPGDRVLVEFEEDEAVVRGVAPRRTRLSRYAGEHGPLQEQVIAANVDVLVIAASAAKPPFRPGLVDRYLIAAQVGGVQPVLCVNKMDLADTEPDEVALYRELGIPVCLTSCETGAGIDALRPMLANRVSVLAGHSGVGKTSLLHALDPDISVHTAEVSEATERGRHTTSAAKLYLLESDTWIIDTPGIRALGLWRVSPEEVEYYFPELAEFARACKFRNCTHTHEPACAVREGVEAGEISKGRYESYLRIRASLEAEDGHTPGRLPGTR